MGVGRTARGLGLAVALVAVAAAGARAEGPAIVPPRMATFAEAKVPAEAADALPPEVTRLEVVMVLTIAVDGTVPEVALRAGVGEPFDGAAMAAARRFVFEPATLDGEPVPVTVPYTYVFELTRTVREVEPPPEPEPPPEEVGEGVVIGLVAEAGTRAPAAGLLVRISAREKDRAFTPREVVSEGDGTFRFEGLPDGGYLVTVPMEDGKEARGIVSVGDGATVEMDPVYGRLGRVSRYRTVVRTPSKKSATRIQLEEMELKTVPGTQGEPTRVVATMPGVARSPFGLPYYIVRGGSFENTGVLIDGFEVFLLYHLFGGPAIVHSDFIGGLEFYPGGFPPEYGRYTAGLIDVETRDPPRETWHLVGNINLLEASALLSFPVDDGKGVMAISARGSWAGVVLSAMFPQLGLDLYYWDYQVRLTYDFSEDTRLTLFAIGAGDELNSDEEKSSSAFESESLRSVYDSMLHRLTARLTHGISSSLTLRSDTMIGYVGQELTASSPGEPSLRIDLDSVVIGQRLALLYRGKGGMGVAAGLDLNGIHLVAELAIPPLPDLGEIPKPTEDGQVFEGRIFVDEWDTALWTELSVRPAEWLTITPGLRAEIFTWNGSGHFTVDPRLTVRAELTDWLGVKATSGFFRQSPQPHEVDSTYGNPNLGPLTALQSSVGTQLTFGEDDEWEVHLTGYYNYMWDIPAVSETITAAGGADGSVERENFTNRGEGRSYGMELMVRKRVGELMYGWLTYTLSRSERNFGTAFTQEEGLLPSGVDTWQPFAFDQTHVLNLAWSFLLPEDITASLRFRLASGNPTPAVVGAAYDADADSHYPLVKGHTRMPVFHQLDVRFDKQFTFDEFLIEVFVDVQNVYYQQNAELLVYSFDYTQRSVFGGIPIIATSGIQYVF